MHRKKKAKSSADIRAMLDRWRAEEELELAALPPERREEMKMYWASESYWRRAGDAARPEYEI